MDPTDIVFTSGAEILRIEDSATVPAGGMVRKEYNMGEFYKRDLDFQSLRGRIINSSLSVEGNIDNILNKIFVKREQELNSLFQSVVLGREFFSFMAKWKVLRDVFHNLSIFKDKNYSSLLKEIQDIIDIRDMFAHGKNTHKGDGSIVIDYFKEKPRREEINPNYLDEFYKKVKLVNENLSQIYSQIP